MDVVQNLKIMNKLGLHARAAAKIVELANSHHSVDPYARLPERE